MTGEPKTGFEKSEDLGPFKCGNCRFFDGKSCGEAHMMRYSQQPRVKGFRRVQVEEEDCCAFIVRNGEEVG